MPDPFDFADELGPSQVIHLYEPSIGLKAVVVIDNTAAGPAIGGVRMAPDVSASEAFRLARAMTLKNAAAGIPHGGGKSVIFGDPLMDIRKKERLIRAFAQAIRELTSYIPGPDMGTDEICMAWVKEEIGRAIGLPSVLGGIPLDQIGATGWGLFHAIEAAAAEMKLPLDGARVVIQGFGAVGSHTARFLADKGTVLVGAAAIDGAIHDPDGIDPNRLNAHLLEGRPIHDFPCQSRLERDEVVGLDCDIWIPAARPDVINAGNVKLLKARLVAEGANIPITGEAERLLHQRGILVLPDFIANAGGVICGSVEYRGGTGEEAFQVIEERIRGNTVNMIREAESKGISPREAALAMAMGRIKQAMSLGRWRSNTPEPGRGNTGGGGNGVAAGKSRPQVLQKGQQHGGQQQASQQLGGQQQASQKHGGQQQSGLQHGGLQQSGLQQSGQTWPPAEGRSPGKNPGKERPRRAV